MSDKKISNGLVEMSALAYFFVALSETPKLDDDLENEFFVSFVEYIRQGNSIKNAIDFAKKEIEEKDD
jgi:hypothetical protein